MSLRSTLAARAAQATDLATSAASGAAQVTLSGVGRAAGLLHHHDASAAARLRALVDEGEQSLSVESFLVLLIDVIHEDDGPGLSVKDVGRAARRRARLIGIGAMFGGKPGLLVASIYTEAMLVCDIVERHGLALTDEQIAAQLLVLWKLSPDLATAGAAIDGSGPSVADRLGPTTKARITDKPLNELSPLEAVKALWALRQVFDEDALPGTTKLRHFVLPGRRTKAITEAVEQQLGVSGRSGIMGA